MLRNCIRQGSPPTDRGTYFGSAQNLEYITLILHDLLRGAILDSVDRQVLPARVGTMALQHDLAALREHFASQDEPPIRGLSLEGGGVAFRVVKDSGDSAEVQLVFAEPSQYPRCGCMLIGGDELEPLNEKFQDTAKLSVVVTEVRIPLGSAAADGSMLRRTGLAKINELAYMAYLSLMRHLVLALTRIAMPFGWSSAQVLRTYGRSCDLQLNISSAAAMDEDKAEDDEAKSDQSMGEASDDWGDDASGYNDEGGSDGQAEDDDDDDDDVDEDDDDEREMIIFCSTNLGRCVALEANPSSSGANSAAEHAAGLTSPAASLTLPCIGHKEHPRLPRTRLPCLVAQQNCSNVVAAPAPGGSVTRPRWRRRRRRRSCRPHKVR